MDVSIREIADFVIARLKSEGFKIQRYDAFSTKSIYLKLDYGVANSIRISDHKGKKHLQYRYNLLKNHNGVHRYKTSEGWDRFYYGFNDVEKMLRDITKARQLKIQSYGDAKYQSFMESNLRDGSQKSGFWAQCVEV